MARHPNVFLTKRQFEQALIDVGCHASYADAEIEQLKQRKLKEQQGRLNLSSKQALFFIKSSGDPQGRESVSIHVCERLLFSK